MSLCSKGITFAPEPRTPSTIDEWLSASETTRTPFPLPFASTSTGITVEFVANPMPTTIAASFSRKRATVASSSRWTPTSPTSTRELHAETPWAWTASITAGVHSGSQPPKPR